MVRPDWTHSALKCLPRVGRPFLRRQHCDVTGNVGKDLDRQCPADFRLIGEVRIKEIVQLENAVLGLDRYNAAIDDVLTLVDETIVIRIVNPGSGVLVRQAVAIQVDRPVDPYIESSVAVRVDGIVIPHQELHILREE